MSTYWDNRIAVEVFDGIPYRMYSDRPHRLDELLVFADHWAERKCMIQGGRIVTFAALKRAIDAKGKLLLDAGIERGDNVFVIGWNGPDWVINYWSCLRIGAVPVLANAWWSDTEIADALALIEPAMVLADTSAAARFPRDKGWRFGPWHCDEHAAKVDELVLSSAEQGSGLDENDPAAIIFTSGTQGQPKAVVLAHRSLLANQLMILDVTRKLPYRPDPAAGDVGLHTGPLFHIGGLHALHRMVLVGNTLVFGSGKFDAGAVLELIERHRVVRWSAVPTMAMRILEHPELLSRDVSSLTAMTLGGSAVMPDLVTRIKAGLPSVEARIATGYGLSENGGQATTASGKDTTKKLGATGRAMPLVEIKVIPAPGLPDGELVIRSPSQMLRYFGPQESPIDAEGWLHTGDLGRVDEEGYVWITGRSKEIIIRGGENIAPAAVEEALSLLPEVIESKVFGVPHPEFGEEVAAVVVVNCDVTVDDLKALLRLRIASFSVPTRWHLQREPLPLNQTGKVDKAALVHLVDLVVS